jgi:hypothetical protein
MPSFLPPSLTQLINVYSDPTLGYRTSLSKIENQRKDQSISKGKLMDNGDNA